MMQIDKDLNSEKAELFLEVKAFLINEMQKYVQGIWEKYSDNITSIFSKEFSGGFCYIRVKDNYVHIGWFNGTRIDDIYGYLFGNGKQIRGHKIEVLDKAQKEAIAYYTKQSYISLVEKQELKRSQ